MKIFLTLFLAKLAHPRSAVEYVEFQNGTLMRRVTLRSYIKI